LQRTRGLEGGMIQKNKNPKKKPYRGEGTWKFLKGQKAGRKKHSGKRRKVRNQRGNGLNRMKDIERKAGVISR